MESLKGQLLIATARLETPIFARSVILMLDHGVTGAMGVIINQPISATVSDLSGTILDSDFRWEKPLSLGGPVPGSLLVLHDSQELADQEIVAGVYLTMDGDSVHQLIHRRPEPSLIVANYSGWGPLQLEGELDRDAWYTFPATSDHVFWTREESLWEVAVREVQSRKLSAILGIRDWPADPRLN